AVVSVARPVHHLQPPRLGGQAIEGSLRGLRGAGKEAGTSRHRRELEEILAAEPPLDALLHIHNPVLLLPPLVTGRTDDPHHLREPVADVRDAMRRRAAVDDAVAVLELVQVTPELE